MKAEGVGQENQWWVDDHQVGLEKRVEPCPDEERRRWLERVQREGDQQQREAHEVHESKTPVLGDAVCFSREGFAPQPGHQCHPSQPHQERAFSCRPRRRESVFHRQVFATERRHVQDGGVVDQKATSEADKRSDHRKVQRH